jgi:hypothetical protein
MSKASDQVFKMLSFQYKPLEKSLLSRIKPSEVKRYNTMQSWQKIRILDGYAASIGL